MKIKSSLKGKITLPITDIGESDPSFFPVESIYFNAFYTVYPEIFASVLFLQNFVYAKFHENKILAKRRNHSVVY